MLLNLTTLSDTTNVSGFSKVAEEAIAAIDSIVTEQNDAMSELNAHVRAKMELRQLTAVIVKYGYEASLEALYGESLESCIPGFGSMDTAAKITALDTSIEGLGSLMSDYYTSLKRKFDSRDYVKVGTAVQQANRLLNRLPPDYDMLSIVSKKAICVDLDVVQQTNRIAPHLVDNAVSLPKSVTELLKGDTPVRGFIDRQNNFHSAAVGTLGDAYRKVNPIIFTPMGHEYWSRVWKTTEQGSPTINRSLASAGYTTIADMIALANAIESGYILKLPELANVDQIANIKFYDYFGQVPVVDLRYAQWMYDVAMHYYYCAIMTMWNATVTQAKSFLNMMTLIK